MKKILMATLLLSGSTTKTMVEEAESPVKKSLQFQIGGFTPSETTPLVVVEPQQQEKSWHKVLLPLMAYSKNVLCFDYTRMPKDCESLKNCSPGSLRFVSLCAGSCYWAFFATTLVAASVTGCHCWVQPTMIPPMSAAVKAACVGVTCAAPLCCNSCCSKCPCDYTEQESVDPCTVSWIRELLVGCASCDERL